MADFSWEIVESLGVLSDNPKGWTKELNLVSWNGREAVAPSSPIVRLPSTTRTAPLPATNRQR